MYITGTHSFVNFVDEEKRQNQSQMNFERCNSITKRLEILKYAKFIKMLKNA